VVSCGMGLETIGGFWVGACPHETSRRVKINI